jgi:WD40 repeat protein
MILTDADHPIRVFDCATGKLLTSFGDKLPEYWNWRHWVSSSSGRLALYVPHPTPQIWDTKTGELIAALPPFKSQRNDQDYQDNYPCAAFLPGDHALVTYRGDGDRGSGPDNLQVWDIDFQKKQVNLRRSLTVVRDARNMEMVGPYLLITGTYYQVLDATTFKSIYQQDPDTSEQLLGLDPPHGDEPGRLLTLELARGGNWTQQQPHFRIVQLPEGKEIERWKCPIEERGGNDHRYQAQYKLSSNRKTIALSQYGRVTFYDFKSGQKISTVQQADSHEVCMMQFLNDNQVLLGKQRGQAPLSICEVSSGKELASIPEIDLYPVASPDGKYIAAKRVEMRVPAEKYVEVVKLPRPLVVIWRRDEP